MRVLNPTPAFRLGCGCVVAGYRLLRCLGRGWESTSYLATEEASGVLRRLKFYRPSNEWPPGFLGHTAATFDLLHPTGAVPAYHHMGVWQRNRREAIPYLVLNYIDGVPLTKMLDRGRWGRTWRPEQALRLAASMARRIAAVHALGRALGDFEYGNNIMVLADGCAMWCDLGPGSPELPNDWYEGDRIDFFTTLDRLLALQPVAPALERAARAIGRWRGCRVRQQTFARISAVLDDLEANGWDRGRRRGKVD